MGKERERFTDDHIRARSARGATVSAIPLPAAIAGTTEIVKLWRQQVGLGAIGADEAAKTAQPLIIGGYDGALYDFAGEKPIEGQTKPPRIVTATVTLGQVAGFSSWPARRMSSRRNW